MRFVSGTAGVVAERTASADFALSIGTPAGGVLEKLMGIRSATLISVPSDKLAARSTRLRSSRTLPGHCRAVRRSRCFAGKDFGRVLGMSPAELDEHCVGN